MSGGAAGAPALVLAFETRIEAPRGRVFAAVTEGRHLARWFCDAGDSEPALNGRLVLRWNRPGSIPFEGRWDTFAAPVSCAYEGGNAGHPDGYGGRVEFTLACDGEWTVLAVRHAIPDRPEYRPFVESYREAWPRALARLAAFLTPES